MKNFVIWCVVLLTMAGTAFSDTKEPPKELAVDLGGGVKMEMVLIPAGSFLMGDAVAKPVHKVRITKPFYLGKYEVTQEQWEAVMGNTPSRSREDKRPVEQITWDDCQEFIEKLNAKTGGQGGKFVLPTEAQWEYACRAGSTSKFCFGDDENQLGEYAWYSKNSGGQAHSVGEKKPNTFGLYDMHGNVWEWCEDWFGSDYYAKSPTDDPRGPTTGSLRVNRGGSEYSASCFCLSVSRLGFKPGSRDYNLGLRVARVPAE
jgi:formylglycine-generating enzyme required for sulfatase activity